MIFHSLGYSLRTGTAPSGLASNRVTNWDVCSGFQPKLQLHPIVFSHCITSCIGYINQSFYNHLTMDYLCNQYNLWIGLYDQYFQLEFIYTLFWLWISPHLWSYAHYISLYPLKWLILYHHGSCWSYPNPNPTQSPGNPFKSL